MDDEYDDDDYEYDDDDNENFNDDVNEYYKEAINVLRKYNVARDYHQFNMGLQKLLIVPKQMKQGSRGGFYYINPRGKKQYLRKDQREKLRSGQLAGCIHNCRPNANN